MVLKGLIIREPWIDLILNNDKTWEIRGFNTKIRGEIALIKSGTSKVFGTINLVDSIFINKDILKSNINKHRIIDTDDIKYKTIYAWILSKPNRFKEPIPYKHPLGAVVWVNLSTLKTNNYN